jgi:ankyrin repeat protein
MSSTSQLLEEITAFCGSESLSEDGLRAIIERHGVAPNNNDPRVRKYHFFHDACLNERITEGILRYLLEYFPNAVRYPDLLSGGRLPLHQIICYNKNITLNMVQLLIDAYPDSVRHETRNGGWIPLHCLCRNKNLGDKEVGLEILELLITRCPESVRHASSDVGNLPIHFAAAVQPPEFCRILIEAYPGSERITTVNHGTLPFHVACQFNTVATAKYLYQLYPESINANNDGLHPIHYAIQGLITNHAASIEIVQFLLDCDPNVVSQKLHRKLPFYWVCYSAPKNNTRGLFSDNTSKLNAFLRVLHILYDAHPEAIESNEVTSNIGIFCEKVQSFINAQLTYARQAREHRLMTTPDENGQLPLHRALRDNVVLGSIKLLVKGNPSAVQSPDSVGALPLHLACLHYDDACVVEFLINLDLSTILAFDAEGNTVLHYACRGAKYETIALLLGEYGGVSVSKRNMNNQLPIDLLHESEAAGDRESIEYTDSIFRLIRAYPDTVL